MLTCVSVKNWLDPEQNELSGMSVMIFAFFVFIWSPDRGDDGGGRESWT